MICLFQEGFVQPDIETDTDNFDNLNGLNINNGNGSALIGGDDETF
jgi:hypothetical protein